MLTLRVTRVDTLLFESDIVAVGSFRCSAADPLFRDSGPIGNPVFAFPRTVTSIRHDDGATFVGDPNTISLYNRHQLYSRSRVSEWDASDWYAIADDILLDAIRAYDPRVEDRPDRPFLLTHVPAPTALYFEQRQLFETLSADAAADRLCVDETVVSFLERVLQQIYGSTRCLASRRGMREQVEAARCTIASDMSRNVSLRELARIAGCSPFALCRAFHTVTGTTATAYRQSLRLRSALELLRSRVDLTTIALDLGYSSHSHFTMAFRRAFGLTPSGFRERRAQSIVTASVACERRNLRSCSSTFSPSHLIDRTPDGPVHLEGASKWRG